METQIDFERELASHLARSRSRVAGLRDQSTTPRDQAYRVLVPRRVRDRLSKAWSRLKANSLYTSRGGVKYFSSEVKVEDVKRIPFAETEDWSVAEKGRLPPIDPRYDEQGRLRVSSQLFHDRLNDFEYERASYRERALAERDPEHAAKMRAREFFDLAEYPVLNEARRRTPAFANSMKLCERRVKSRGLQQNGKPAVVGVRTWSRLRNAHAEGSAAWTSRDMRDAQAVGYVKRCLKILGRTTARRTTGEKILLVTWLGSSVSFLSNLSFDIQCSIIDFMTVRKFRAGRAVYEHGSRGSEVYFVVTGRLTSERGDTREVSDINPGDVFGEPERQTKPSLLRVCRFGKLVRHRVIPTVGRSLFDSLLVTRTTTVKAIDDTTVVAVKWSIVSRYRCS